jgi:hypothetical protein
MGSFRSEPELTKHTTTGTFDKISYAVSHMCGKFSFTSGWRIYMEDAHISLTDFKDKKLGLFGVFDGHGGSIIYIQGLNAQLLYNAIFLINSNQIRILKKVIMKKR